MKIPVLLKEKMSLVAAVGVLCQMGVQAKPVEKNNSTSTSKPPAASKTSSDKQPGTTMESVRREQIEKIRREKGLRSPSQSNKHNPGIVSNESDRQGVRSLCLKCGRG
ncbi:MAG: hypothetical protein K2X77_03685 [Candidatus Obscuribacterales bacterium]|jgi:hypothetical protein|nr:hypothetical protein [Candidatus Obscuribacterales bacterium]